MTPQQKIIGRFEPIGKEVGRPRAGFDVLTKEDWIDPKSGRPGFKGTSPNIYGDTDGPETQEYSVISEFWRWVRAECEHDFEGRAPDGGPISMQQPVIYVCSKCGEQENV